MRCKTSEFSFKIIVAIALVSFVPFIFLNFKFTFASCYIDDGCGIIDNFVPFIVLILALISAILSGFSVIAIIKLLGLR
jgi:hypothetical protein